MTTVNFIQEQLSVSYVRAVVFRTGFNLYRPEIDNHGIDGTIVNPAARGVNRVDYQLKATTRWQVNGDVILYDLRVEDYNRLVREDDVPRVLILFLMPNDEGQWLAQSREELCLRKCAFWADLMGKAPSANTSTVRVEVASADVFDGNGLLNMFSRLTV